MHDDMTSTYNRKHVSVAIVGAGITGAAAAVRLAQARSSQLPDLAITLFDLGSHNPGGRLSTRAPRAVGQPQFDHGAQAIGQASSAAFTSLLSDWERLGLVQSWRGACGVLDASAGTVTATAGGPAPCVVFGVPLSASHYVAVPSMASLVARQLDSAPGGVQLRLRTRVAGALLTHEDGSTRWRLHGGTPTGTTPPTSDLGTFDAVILTDSLAAKPGSPGHVVLQAKAGGAHPAQQEAALLDAAGRALDRVATLRRVPLFSLMVAFDTDALAGCPLLGDDQYTRAAVINSPSIAWLAEDSSKPGRAEAMGGRSLTTLVAISTRERAQELLGPTEGPLPPQTQEYLAARAEAMWADVRQVLERARGGAPLPAPSSMAVHRWGSAYVDPPLGETCVDCAGCGSLVLAGDYCLGPGIENAVLSGLAAADAVLAGLQRPAASPL